MGPRTGEEDAEDEEVGATRGGDGFDLRVLGLGFVPVKDEEISSSSEEEEEEFGLVAFFFFSCSCCCCFCCCCWIAATDVVVVVDSSSCSSSCSFPSSSSSSPSAKLSKDMVLNELAPFLFFRLKFEEFGGDEEEESVGLTLEFLWW